MLEYTAYTLFHLVLSPVLALRGLARARRRGYGRLMRERLFGGGKPPHKADWTAVYAGYMGEARLGERIARELAAELGLDTVLLVATDEAAKTRDGVLVRGAPFNSPFSVLLFLARWGPRELIAVGSVDAWHVKALARLTGTSVFVVDGDLTGEEAARQSGRFGHRHQFALPNGYTVSSAAGKDLLASLGADPATILVETPLSLNVSPPKAALPWHAVLGSDAGDLVIVAGCTHPEDEGPVLTAFEAVRQVIPDARLILAPRRVERAPEVAAKVKAAAIPCVLRTEGISAPPGAVLVLDTIGELRDAYSGATVAFIGGTFGASRGGHSPSEAVAWGVPLTLGCHFEQHRSAYEFLREAGTATFCPDAEHLANAWKEAYENPAVKERAEALARRLAEEGEGQIARLYRKLTGLRPSGAKARPSGQ
ncbi:MAG: hypothetical protein KIT11_01070 [Fimbriimonadaceae bacterium]|nr:hypothetical protein [Fimbriimonadaceae bacterium]QYK55035.1 MAG: hypothetical protein KF733_08465 [Fimbriimonadaceae bacterium]